MSILKAKKVVVVDDEQMMTELVGDMLKAMGAVVYSTNDPAQAVQLVRIHDPDLIILDRQMPEITGLDILKKLKAHHAYKDIPVIMLTGANQEKEIREAIATGAEGYVTKPFKPTHLVKQINTIIEKKKDIWFIS